ncbi:MAG TPA: FadR/GntR family transcriptional regulator [Rhodocyclaceae bacterium]|nr:FadR/GntR family transcriptional regulator [Rhodocyclaceae bacterium]
MSGDRPARLSEAVARQLEQWISDERLEPGTQLPTEKVLCERFGVSRAVIREAISRLKADGCVRTRQGSGAYVAARPGQASFRLLRDGTGGAEVLPREVSDVFELRYLIETGAAELAALRRGEGDLERMRVALERMREALVEGTDALAEDDAFHVAVAAATHNPQLERFQVFMGQQLSESRAPTWSAAGHLAGWARQAQQEHEHIFAAIAAGDAAGARAAAAAHLVRAASRLGLDPLRWAAADIQESRQ